VLLPGNQFFESGNRQFPRFEKHEESGTYICGSFNSQRWATLSEANDTARWCQCCCYFSSASLQFPHSMKTIVLLAIGWLCILVGAAGLVLPFVPGTVLLLTGVILLSQHYHWARRLLALARVRFPNAWRSINNYSAKLACLWMRRKGNATTRRPPL
jgi:hypothetical protein